MPVRSPVGIAGGSPIAEPNRQPNRQHGRLNWLWVTLAAPGMLWMAMFFLIPFYAVAAVAFGNLDPILQTASPEWNPLQWNFASFNEVIDRVVTGDLGTVFMRTGLYVVLAVFGCVLVGYPVAYFVARFAGRWKALLLAC